MKKLVKIFISLVLSMCLSISCSAITYSDDASTKCDPVIQSAEFAEDGTLVVTVAVENRHTVDATKFTIGNAYVLFGNQYKFRFSGAIKNKRIAAQSTRIFTIKISAKKVPENMTESALYQCEYVIWYEYKANECRHAGERTVTVWENINDVEVS